MKDCGTILIVDSDDASRLTAVQVAVRLGYDARPTPTADELIERLGQDRPALAIVEVELPGPWHRSRGHAPAARGFRQPSPGDSGLGSADRRLRPDGGPHARSGRLPLEATRRRRAPRTRQAVASSRSAAHERGRERQRAQERADRGPRPQPTRARDPEPPRRWPTQGQIATELVISPKTVATHIQHILSKLGVHTRAQAVALAFRRGLVDPDVRAHALALLTAPE